MIGNKFALGHKLSESHKRKICGDARRGVLSPLWIVDRSKLAKANEHRNSSAHREWSKEIKKRDSWKCRIADESCSGKIEAHHILGWRSHPDLRYKINNGITLCHYHHPRKREEENRLSPYFQSLVEKEN